LRDLGELALTHHGISPAAGAALFRAASSTTAASAEWTAEAAGDEIVVAVRTRVGHSLRTAHEQKDLLHFRTRRFRELRRGLPDFTARRRLAHRGIELLRAGERCRHARRRGLHERLERLFLRRIHGPLVASRIHRHGLVAEAAGTDNERHIEILPAL